MNYVAMVVFVCAKGCIYSLSFFPKFYLSKYDSLITEKRSRLPSGFIGISVFIATSLLIKLSAKVVLYL